MGLEDRVAVITGATGGLGRVTARALAAQGARLALWSKEAEHLAQLAKDLALPADRVLTRALDVGNAEETRAAAKEALRALGRVDILLHLVGGWVGGKPVVEVEPGQVSEMLHQHFWTTFSLAQALVPHLVANRWGRLIAVSSPAASRPLAKRLPYAVGKAAQETLFLTLARELEGSGVTANLLLVDTIDVEHARERNPSPKNANWTTPEEITAAILFLCSDEARAVNGARLPLYGSG